MTQENRLERAGADLRAAVSSMSVPKMRRLHGLRSGVMAFAAGLALVALVVGVPAYIARSPTQGGGVVGASDTTSTSHAAEVTTTPAVATTTTTFKSASFACGAELPWALELPKDFTGPHDGPGPHSSSPADEGQLVIHWLGRDGSVEIRWPVNSEHLEGAEWGTPMDWSGRDFDEFAVFLFNDPDPETLETVGASEVLPTELMESPCDAAQLNVFASSNDSGFGSSATFGQSEDTDLIIYPNLPRQRDKVLVVETLEITDIPEVIQCKAPDEAEKVPPNLTGTTPDGPIFDTPEGALADLLSTDVAATWPKTGYFALLTPDGTVIYGNPLDDMSPDPRPDNGLVISVTVVEADSGWTVTEWETSGC